MVKKFPELRNKMTPKSQVQSKKTFDELIVEYERMSTHLLMMERVWAALIGVSQVVKKLAPNREDDFLTFCGQVMRHQEQIQDIEEVCDPNIPYLMLRVALDRPGRKKFIVFQLGVPKQDKI